MDIQSFFRKHNGSLVKSAYRKSDLPPIDNALRMNEQVESFDEVSFYQMFTADLRRAQDTIVIYSPFLTARGIERLRSAFKNALARGVRVCIYTLEPDDWQRRGHADLSSEVKIKLVESNKLFQQLLSLGAHLNLRQKIHEKLAIVDGNILWDGSLNILSHRNTSERMTRWISRRQANDAIAKHKLDTCADCWHEITAKSVSDEKAHARLLVLCQDLTRARMARSLSQQRVASLIGNDQSLISKFERAACFLNTKVLLQIATCLGCDIMLVPTLLRPAVEHLISQRLRLLHGDSISDSPLDGD